MYFNSPTGECLFCNSTEDMFIISLVDEMCVPCPLTNCIDCLSYSECGECNMAEKYYLSGKVCVLCDEENN